MLSLNKVKFTQYYDAFKGNYRYRFERARDDAHLTFIIHPKQNKHLIFYNMKIKTLKTYIALYFSSVKENVIT